MKREEKYRKRYLKKLERHFFFIFIVLLMVFILCGFLLGKHLLKIQNLERISKLKDYTEYTLEVHSSPFCKENPDRLIYENDTERIYLSCLQEVYVNYGNTKTTLKTALEKGYLNSESLLINTFKEVENDYIKYTYNSVLVSSKSDDYVVYKFMNVFDKTNIYIKAL